MMRFNRPLADELKDMKVVVLHGTSERKDIYAAGWVEDVPHHDASEAIVLHETIHFIHAGPSGGASVDISVIMPHRGLPLSTEFFEYGKVEMHEMSTAFGQFYASAVLKLRGEKVNFAPKILNTVPTPVQGVK